MLAKVDICTGRAMPFTPLSFNMHSTSICSLSLNTYWEKKQERKDTKLKEKYSEIQASTSCARSVINLSMVQLRVLY